MSYDKTLIKQKGVYLDMKYAIRLEKLSRKLRISESKIIAGWIIEKLEELQK